MSRYVAIDLASLPPIDAVVPPDAALIVAARKQAILGGIADATLRAEVAAVLALESEPLTKDVEAGAYRELIHYQRVNEAVRAVMVSTARGADLDNICARLDVQRMTITPATDTIAAVMESDEDLRYRYQLAPEAFSVAGPYGAYEFHARSAHPLVKDAAVYGPESGLVEPGFVRVVVLARTGTGAASREITDAVFAKLSNQDCRPLTDFVQVRTAAIATYTICYHLHVRVGADPSLIVTNALAALESYAHDCHRVGRPVVITALDSAAHLDRANVIRAIRVQPPAEVDPGIEGAAWCTGVTVTYEVVQG